MNCYQWIIGFMAVLAISVSAAPLPPATTDSTWSGSVVIQHDTVIPPFMRVIALPGTRILLGPGVRLTVKGFLWTTGTWEEPVEITSLDPDVPGSGIWLMDEDPDVFPFLTGLFSYTQIFDLDTGIAVERGYLSLSSSDIFRCREGIRLLPAAAGASLLESRIADCETGCLALNNPAENIFENTLVEYCRTGISLSGGWGRFIECAVQNCREGITVSGGVLMMSEGTGLAENRILYNTDFGIRADSGKVYAGQHDPGGGNSIYGNGTDVVAVNDSRVMAIGNYWGAPRPSKTQFFVAGGSEIVFTPWLTSPPGTVNPVARPSLAGITLYPNPVTNTLHIDFSLSAPHRVDLRIVNPLGQPVIAGISRNLPAGSHRWPVDVRGLASGVYVCELTAGGNRRGGKFICLR